MSRLIRGRMTKQSRKEMKKLRIQEEEEADQQTEVEEKSSSSNPVDLHLIRYQENSLHAKPKTGSMR